MEKITLKQVLGELKKYNNAGKEIPDHLLNWLKALQLHQQLLSIIGTSNQIIKTNKLSALVTDIRNKKDCERIPELLSYFPTAIVEDVLAQF